MLIRRVSLEIVNLGRRTGRELDDLGVPHSRARISSRKRAQAVAYF
jgi:hypothetical protein